MSDIWLTSEGLDVHFDDDTEEIVKVKYGQLEGTFMSLESFNNRLEFQTSNLDLAFRYFEPVSYTHLTLPTNREL